MLPKGARLNPQLLDRFDEKLEGRLEQSQEDRLREGVGRSTYERLRDRLSKKLLLRVEEDHVQPEDDDWLYG